MQKVDFIVFSKNRPMQLRSLLESLFYFMNVDLINSVSVLYEFDPHYEKGYEVLKDEFESVSFLKESNFRDQTVSLVNQASEMCCFLVDDILFYRRVESAISPAPDEVCFSLRLGKNCKFSHPANSWYNPPHFVEDDLHLSWEWKSSEYDFGYPFSLDGHVFRKKDILGIVERIYFRSPNSLENGLVYTNPFMDHFLSMRMKSFKQSCVVGVPVNRVNNEVPNRFGTEFSISEKSLQDLFDEGHKIDWMGMDYKTIKGPHEELEYKFNKV
jgi:hypothetical protein